jgi:hypothetical protein
MTRYDMGAETLGVLTSQTTTASDDLGAQVHLLAVAADPLEGHFNGQGRTVFDRFKAESDRIATELDAAARR